MASSKADKTVKQSAKSKTSRSSPALLKVVVRRLPHQMKEEEFVKALAAAAADAGMGERGGSWDLMYFTPGKMSKKRGKVTGTAYLHIDRGRGASADLSLINLRAAVLASEAFTPVSGGKSGSDASSIAVKPTVETAPFQKLFKQKPKRDIRVGTIEKDATYRAFCAALQSPAPPLPSADVQADIKASEGKEEPKPQNALLDFLKERGAKKMRDSQRVAALGSSAHRGGGSSRRVSNSSGSGAGSATAGAKTSVSASKGTSKAAAAAAAAAPSSATSSKNAPSSSSSGVSPAPSRPPPPSSSSSQGSLKTSSTGTGVSVMSASYRATLAKAAAAAAAAETAKPTPSKQGSSESSKNRSSSTKGGGSGSRGASKGGNNSSASAAPTPTPRILSRAKDSKTKPSSGSGAGAGAASASAPTAAQSSTGSSAASSRSAESSSGGGESGRRGGGGGGGGGKGRAGGKSSSNTSGSSRSKK